MQDHFREEEEEEDAGMDYPTQFAPMQAQTNAGTSSGNPAGFQGSFQSSGAGGKRAPTYLPTVEEPICVLNIELDGEHNEEIKILENDDPAEVVQRFGDRFNLSTNARENLIKQIREQINIDSSF
jgi:hypothetical protein